MWPSGTSRRSKPASEPLPKNAWRGVTWRVTVASMPSSESSQEISPDFRALISTQACPTAAFGVTFQDLMTSDIAPLSPFLFGTRNLHLFSSPLHHLI